MSTTTHPSSRNRVTRILRLYPPTFEVLKNRLASTVHRLNLAAWDLYDLALTPHVEHHSAACVVQEVAQELAQIYDDFKTWQIYYDYTPRDMEPLKKHIRQLSEETTESNSQDQPW